MSASLYILSSPADSRIYVGRTTQTLRDRLNAHRSEARCGGAGKRCEWLRALESLGAPVEIDLVEEVSDEGRASERALIASLSMLGVDLLNGNAGGDGPVSGRPKTREHVEKVAAANLGKHSRPVHSAEVRAEMSRTRKGRRHSAEARARMSEAMRAAHARRREMT